MSQRWNQKLQVEMKKGTCGVVRKSFDQIDLIHLCLKPTKPNLIDHPFGLVLRDWFGLNFMLHFGPQTHWFLS